MRAHLAPLAAWEYNILEMDALAQIETADNPSSCPNATPGAFVVLMT
jgi:hypothetical protein